MVMVMVMVMGMMMMIIIINLPVLLAVSDHPIVHPILWLC